MTTDYVPLLFPAIGVLLLIIAFVLLVMTQRFVRAALRTQGTVVALAERRGRKNGRTYSPVVSYATQTGQFQFTDSMGRRPAGYSVGDRVEVLYHWQDHGRARLASPFRLYFVPGLVGLLGLLFTLIGMILFFAANAGRL
jgi:hypothetical protein